jgi:hypothetical protein
MKHYNFPKESGIFFTFNFDDQEKLAKMVADFTKTSTDYVYDKYW